jgi:hypothetical protein
MQSLFCASGAGGALPASVLHANQHTAKEIMLPSLLVPEQASHSTAALQLPLEPPLPGATFL